MEFTSKDVFTFSVLSLLLTLIIYHIFIYFGRHGKERMYYIYFCSFAFSFFLDHLVGSDLQRFIFPSEKIRQLIAPGVTGICYFLINHFALKMLKIIFVLPSSKNKLLLPFYISFSIYGVLLGSYLLLGYSYYIEHIFPFLAIFAGIGPVYMVIYFAVYFFKTERIKKGLPSIIILFGFFIFLLDFFLEEVLELFAIHYIFKDTYLVSGISVIIWAFALAMRFNNEHKELGLLKNRLEEKVEERTLQLQSANELRTNTFIELAHETRTPLTLIKNNIDDYTAKYGGTKELDKVKTNIDKINELMGNILNIDRFEKGQTIYSHNKVINISSFATIKINNFEPYAKKKNLKLISNIPNDIYLKISPNALDSLLDNLIANAIKFTEQGSISVSLSRKEKTILSVKDTGVGIPVDVQDKIFEPYFHFSKNDTPGFGIGLSIVKNIVKSINGAISFTSNEGAGTEFIVEFEDYQLLSTDKVFDDYKVIPSHFEVTEFVKDETIHQDKPSVLIIEDNPDLLIYLKEKLKQSYNIHVAPDGNIALKKIKEIPTKPDLIISDVMMGSLDGLGFYEQLKRTDYHYIPLIYITAKANSTDRDKALEMGAMDYIYKPFEISEVKKKIASIIKNSKRQRNLAIDNVKKMLDSENILFNATVSKDDEFEENCNLYKISNRERDIIKLAREGKTYNEIADELNISKKTVDTHFQNIFKKIGVNKLQELLNKLFN